MGSGFSSGNGGNAVATATASSVSSQAQATAIANGGNGGVVNNSSLAGTGGTAMATAISHGVTVTDFDAVGATPQIGGSAGAQVTWTSASGATVVVGQSAVNNGQGVVTGPLANMRTVTGTGTLTIGNGSNATVLQINPNSPASTQSSLIISADSTLDITNNSFFIAYPAGHDPIASIEQWIKNGYFGTAGAPAIISSSIATDDSTSGLSYGIGYADSADSGNPADLPTDTIEIAFTLLGDANLDGTVNAEDFTPFSHNLGKSGTVWDQGDFNYDGTVNAEDFTSFSHNLGQTAACHHRRRFAVSGRPQPGECAGAREC